MVLFEGGDEILPTFGDRLSGKATRELTRLGVDVRVKTRVTDVTRDEIVVSGADGEERLACRTKVWAAGVAASPLARSLAEATGAEVDRAGRIQVLPDCTLPGHPEIYVVGDVMALDGLPGVAEVAMQTGIHAAASIKRQVSGHGDPRPFKYRDLGSMAAVSRFRAIVDFKGIRVGRLRRLGDVGVHPPDVPHRLQEPVRRRHPLGAELRRPVAHRARPGLGPHPRGLRLAGVRTGRATGPPGHPNGPATREG